MASEGERPKSSWQSWVRSTERRRAPEPEPAAPPAAEPAPVREAPEAAVDDAGPAHPDTGDGDGTEADLRASLEWGGDAAGDDWGDADADVDADAAAFFDDGFEADEPGPVVVEVDDDDDEEDDLGDDDFGELVPTIPLLPTIAGRVEALSGVLRSISHSVDGLTATTDVYRSATVDRIDEFTGTVLEQGRRADQSLEEYRRTTERAIGELRRRLAEQGDTTSKLLGRIEEVATDVATLVTVAAAPVAAPEPVVAPEPPPPPVPPVIEVDLEPITAGLAAQSAAVGNLEAAVGGLDVTVSAIIDQLAAIERFLAELPVPEPPPPPAAVVPPPEVDLGPVLGRLADVHALVEAVVDTMPGSAEGSGTDVGAALEELRAAITKAPSRGRTPAIDDAAVTSIAEAVIARLDLDALASLVAEHLTGTFEVVTEAPADTAPRRRK